MAPRRDALHRNCLLRRVQLLGSRRTPGRTRSAHPQTYFRRGRPLRNEALSGWLRRLGTLTGSRAKRPNTTMRLVYRTCRSLLNRPKFCFAIILTLALGIGANSAIFSVIDAVLLQPLPYPGGDRVVAIFQSNPDQQVVRGDLSPAQVE